MPCIPFQSAVYLFGVVEQDICLGKPHPYTAFRIIPYFLTQEESIYDQEDIHRFGNGSISFGLIGRLFNNGEQYQAKGRPGN